MRGKHAWIVNAGQNPGEAEKDRRDRKPAPEARSGKREGSSGDDGKIEVKRPIARSLIRNDERREIGAHKAEACKRRTMQKGGRKRCERDSAEEKEGDGRPDKSVERVSRIDICICDGRACRRQHAGDISRGKTGDSGIGLVSPRPFAGSDQRNRKQRAKSDAHNRPEPPPLDRIADEEKSTERKREPSDQTTH